MSKLIPLCLAVSMIVAFHAKADESLIEGYGPYYPIEQSFSYPGDTKFKVLWDVAKSVDEGKLNNHINSVARFYNMHLAHGTTANNLDLALVLHGKATFDALSAKHYKERFGYENQTTQLIEALLEKGVKVVVCGQSATYQNVSADQLIDGVEMALSAMTANAVLQQQGYTLNPF